MTIKIINGRRVEFDDSISTEELNELDQIDTTSEITEEAFLPKNCKLKITTMIDEDIVHGLKLLAQSQNTKYQTLINDILRDFINSKTDFNKYVKHSELISIIQNEIKQYTTKKQA